MREQDIKNDITSELKKLLYEIADTKQKPIDEEEMVINTSLIDPDVDETDPKEDD